MGNRLSKISTRTGDDGSTGLGDGTRTRKDSLRVAVMGDVDELNSHIGVLLTETLPENIQQRPGRRIVHSGQRDAEPRACRRTG
jgi:cob(I)alamin adenosyltransferase